MVLYAEAKILFEFARPARRPAVQKLKKVQSRPVQLVAVVIPVVLPELTGRGLEITERVILGRSSLGGQTEDVIVPSPN